MIHRTIKSYWRRFGTALLVGIAGLSPVLAQDVPYTSIWTVTGPFTLYYHGTLKDGTACSPSINALQWSISAGLAAPEYFHGFSVAQDAKPEIAAAFKVGTFCSIAFEGSVRFTLNWGKFAQITPEKVSPPEPIAADASLIPLFEGHMRLRFQRIMCIMAPCPPGNYTILAGNQVLVILNWTATVTVEDATVEPHAIKTYPAKSLPFQEFDGAIWNDENGLTIYLDHSGPLKRITFAGYRQAHIRLYRNRWPVSMYRM